ncbi:type II secretion system protein GspN [Myxococcota bacterium]|nr:type II secretion system protein GspN [Myxococcota bacterium]MBU1897484.1 type II secretion system protein GspN [Myxococcota bacterium]
MKGFARGALKYLGYTVFFLLSFALFFYLTLPTEAIEGYLVRKAADEYGADLTITDLSISGLSGFSVEGVTLTPRPTPEEMAEIRVAREARAAWKARKEAEAKQKAEAAKAGAEAPEAGSKGKKGKKKKKDVEVAKGASDDAAKGASNGAANGVAKGAAKGASKSAVVVDEPPPIPRGPQPVFVEHLKVSLSPFELIKGRLSGDLDAAILGGQISASLSQGREAWEVEGKWSDLDLSQLSFLTQALGVPLAGALSGETRLTIPLNDKGEAQLADIGGETRLAISDGSVGPGKIESDKFGAFKTFDLPKARFGALSGAVRFDKRRAQFEEFTFKGKDLEGELTGRIELNQKLERWNPRAHIRFRFSEPFLKEHSLKTLMTRMDYIRRGTDSQGFTGFEVKGSLKQPKMTPKKISPYKQAPRAAKKVKRTAPAKAPAAAVSKGAANPRQNARDLAASRRKQAKTDLIKRREKRVTKKPTVKGKAGAPADEAEGDEAEGDEAEGDEAEGDEAEGDEAEGDEAEGDEAEGEEAVEGEEAAGGAGGAGGAEGEEGAEIE